MEIDLKRIDGGRYEPIGNISNAKDGNQDPLAVVCLGWDSELGRATVIKCPNLNGVDESTKRKRFTIERRIHGQLLHPHIVQLYDFGEYQDDHGRRIPYVVLEFGGHVSLQRILQYLRDENDAREREGEKFVRLRIDDVRRILEHMHAALAHVHEKKFAHRDIKPGNVCIFPVHKGELYSIKLLDFGMAKDNEGSSSKESITVFGTICGTLGYLSPERHRGLRFEERDEIWAMATMFYELLCLEHPLKLSPEGMRCYDGNWDRRNCPDWALRFFDKAFAAEPSGRHGELEQFCAGLDDLLKRNRAPWATDQFDEMSLMQVHERVLNRDALVNRVAALQDKEKAFKDFTAKGEKALEQLQNGIDASFVDTPLMSTPPPSAEDSTVVATTAADLRIDDEAKNSRPRRDLVIAGLAGASATIVLGLAGLGMASIVQQQPTTIASASNGASSQTIEVPATSAPVADASASAAPSARTVIEDRKAIGAGAATTTTPAIRQKPNPTINDNPD